MLVLTKSVLTKSVSTKSVSTNSGWTQHARRIAFAGALGLALVAAFLPARAQAQDDDEDDKKSGWNFDRKILNDLMRSFGLKNGNESTIEYRERSPLVIPPSKTLPPPEQAGAGRSAAWPVDPDVKRKKEVAAKKKDRKGYDPDYEGRNLTPSELNPPGVGRSAGRAGTPDSMGNEGSSMRPSELGYFGGLFSSFGGKDKEEVATFDKEPPRTSLTAPPSGYQTPSAAQPYGLSKKDPKLTVTPYDPAVGN
jgi:hypothetical protein